MENSFSDGSATVKEFDSANSSYVDINLHDPNLYIEEHRYPTAENNFNIALNAGYSSTEIHNKQIFSNENPI